MILPLLYTRLRYSMSLDCSIRVLWVKKTRHWLNFVHDFSWPLYQLFNPCWTLSVVSYRIVSG